MAAMAIIGLLVSASAANAGTVRLDFDFTVESVLSLLGGTIITPPDGSFDSGTVRVLVEATDIDSVVGGGQVAVGAGNFAGSVSKDVLGLADVSGPFSGTQIGTLLGVLDPGLTSATFFDDLMINLNFNFACVGAGCGPLGFPVSILGLTALNLGTVSITGLDTEGTARIEMNTIVELDGVLGELSLVGIETSRIFIVPEPQTALLVVLGLVTLSLTRSRRS
jgi:hypothetical protein